MTRKPADRPIRAAGGLLERRDGGSLRIAVIRRKRYRHSDGTPGDWSLPKGKREKGETLEETALREVREETGLGARLTGGEPFEIGYVVAGRPKSVTYFRMTCDAAAHAGEPDGSEVDVLEWLTPAVALARLTYDSERGVVAAAYGLAL